MPEERPNTPSDDTNAMLPVCLLTVGVRLLGVWLLVLCLYDLAGIAAHVLEYPPDAWSFLLLVLAPLLIRFDLRIARWMTANRAAAPPAGILARWRFFCQAVAALLILLHAAPPYASAMFLGAPYVTPETMVSKPYSMFPAVHQSPEAAEAELHPMSDEELENRVHYHHGGTKTHVRVVTLGLGPYRFQLEEPPPTATAFFLGVVRFLAIFCLVAWLLRPPDNTALQEMEVKS